MTTSVEPFVGTTTVVKRSSELIVGGTAAPSTVAVMSDSLWTYWRSPTRSSRVSNFCDTSAGTTPVNLMVCFTRSVPSLDRLPSAINVDAVPSACAVNASGPASRPQVRRQNAIIAAMRCSVLGRLASTRYSLPLAPEGRDASPKSSMRSRARSPGVPGYRCACEPATVEWSSVRTTPGRSTGLTRVRILWGGRTPRLAVRIGGLLPDLPLATVRTAVLRRRCFPVRTESSHARAAQEKSAAHAARGDDHHRPDRSGGVRDHWAELRSAERGLSKRQLPGSSAGEKPAADPRAANVRSSGAVDHQECVLQPDHAGTSALRFPANQRLNCQ